MKTISAISGNMHEEGELPLFWIMIGTLSMAFLVSSTVGLHHYLVDYVLLVISLAILSRLVKFLVTERKISVDLLMGIAGIVTWYLHAILEGFLIFALYSASELIEHWAEHYAKRKLTGLRELLPKEIATEVNGNIIIKNLNEVHVGDVVLVKPGEVVPADGIIIDGMSTFDTSYITGEPEPLPLGKGDYVVSGYINKDRLVRVRILRKPSESLLQLLVVEAEKALKRKASIQRFIERFSQPYTILVLGVFGLALLILAPYRALAILLAGCPSAFIISSSTATALSIAVLARRSTVVRGGQVLENTSKVKAIVFDKTGTITLGKMRITKIASFNGFDKETVLRYAGGAAKASDHPISKVIAEYSKLTPLSAEEYPGKGVKAVVDGRKVCLGSREFVKEQEITVKHNVCGNGEREVLVVIEDKLAGTICLEEELSSEARNVITSLKEKGLHIVIASGDKTNRVRKIAEYLGIHEYFGELNPEDKRKLVTKLRSKYGKVAFVGDGINDLEALAEADVGMAIGSLRVVSNIGDIVLLKGINTIPLVIRYARKYMKSIYMSVILALIIKLIAMALGIIGLIPLWVIVGIGDDGATLVALGVIGYMLSRT